MTLKRAWYVSSLTQEKLYEKEVTLAHRETVELEADDILLAAHTGNVAFLVVGDPLSATTHSDLIMRARTFQAPGASAPTPVDVRIIHNASITTALGSSGLAGYNFGQTISVPFWTEDWRPDSWLERIGENMGLGLHTLCLSDIKVREQSIEDMSRYVARLIQGHRPLPAAAVYADSPADSAGARCS